MNVQDGNSGLIQLPPESEALHRSIAKKAAEVLGKLVDGNGMKAEQIKLSREETQIHRIPAFIAAKLTTEVVKTRVRGKAAQGVEVSSAAEVATSAEDLATKMLKDADIHRLINDSLKNDPGHGFGMDQLIITLPALRKDFSIVSPCPRCHGQTSVPCMQCNATGNMPCTACAGNGFSNCKWCHGMGRVPNQQGAYIPCLHCQNTGRISCQICRGQRYLACTACRGQKSVGCMECGQKGFFTEVHQVNYKAQCAFEADWREVPPEVKSAAHKLGLRELATEKHAEILWQSPEARPDAIYIPCIAFLPIAKAEFSAPEGKIYPALVAGLQGRIIEIEPVLDQYVKPGISALMKLSKGPMARQALIDTACKYRLIRQVLAGLTRSSKKIVYQRLCKNYPLMLSDKYARATIKYADSAVATLSDGPRYKGLALGTLLAALAAAVYFMTSLRLVLLAQLTPQYILAADIIVWILSWTGAVYVIKFITASSLRKILPVDKGGLPSSGLQGLAAGLTTGLVWFAVAARAAEKPEWIVHILKLVNL